MFLSLLELYKNNEVPITQQELCNRNYAVGIKSPIFPLRSMNKTKGFPITQFLPIFATII